MPRPPRRPEPSRLSSVPSLWYVTFHKKLTSHLFKPKDSLTLLLSRQIIDCYHLKLGACQVLPNFVLHISSTPRFMLASSNPTLHSPSCVSAAHPGSWRSTSRTKMSRSGTRTAQLNVRWFFCFNLQSSLSCTCDTFLQLTMELDYN